MREFDNVHALTFDLFGLILDPAGSLTPAIAEFLQERGVDLSAADCWSAWRARKRIEQYQDTILSLGHSGYLETGRRALVFALRLMKAWRQLSPCENPPWHLLTLSESQRINPPVAYAPGSPSTFRRHPFNLTGLVEVRNSGFSQSCIARSAATTIAARDSGRWIRWNSAEALSMVVPEILRIQRRYSWRTKTWPR